MRMRKAEIDGIEEMTMDKRPRRPDGSIYPTCEKCGMLPYICKGYCIPQMIAKEIEKETNRRKENGNRI